MRAIQSFRTQRGWERAVAQRPRRHAGYLHTSHPLFQVLEGLGTVRGHEGGSGGSLDVLGL